MRTCRNCANRCTVWGMCIVYEMADSAEEEREAAESCNDYEEEADIRPYTKSATAGDYGPSNPWNAEGMRISDFI